MAGLNDEPDLLVTLRRYGKRQLTGADLAEIRTNIFKLSQTDLARDWGITQVELAGLEQAAAPDLIVCDAYRGRLFLHFMER